MVMNGELTVVPALDIFLRVGRGVAHDEYVPFTVAGNTLMVGGQESPLRGSKVKVEFVKVCWKTGKFLWLASIAGFVVACSRMYQIP